MHTKYFPLLLPVMLAGCNSVSTGRESPVPALVFVDGQIQDSAEVISQTQRRIAPPAPRAMPRPDTPLSSATISPGVHPARPRLVMTGTPTAAPVTHLPLLRNQTGAEIIKRLLPSGWQLQQQNAATPALNIRLVSWSSNDQWHRSLNRLLQDLRLYGHIDWSRRILTLSTSATLPATPPSPTLTPPQSVMPSTPAVPVSPASTGAMNRPAAAPGTERATLPGLVMHGNPENVPVIFLSGDRLSAEQWVMRLLPAQWSLSWSGVPQKTRLGKVRDFSANDQWYRALGTLMTQLQLQGRIDWDKRQLIIAPAGSAPDDPAGKTVVSPARTAAAATVPAPASAWVAESASTLRKTLSLWAEKAACSVPGQGAHWRVVWLSSVDYPIDARFDIRGSWEQAIEQTFALYQSAHTPLYYSLYTRQCLVRISDKAAGNQGS